MSHVKIKLITEPQWSSTHGDRARFQFSVLIYMYAIMKTMCPPGYHHKRFVATHALGTSEPKSAQQAKQRAWYK